MDFVLAAGRPVAVTCGPDPGEDAPRACKLFDLYKGRAFHAFGSDNLRAVGGVDEHGRPEVRLALHHGGRPGEDRRVTLDGTVRVIDKEGRANISEPGGGLLMPIDKENSLLVDIDGRQVVRFPFHAQRCGNGWPNWSGFCRFSADGRRWLVPVRGPRAADSEVQSSGLTLFDVPVGGR